MTKAIEVQNLSFRYSEEAKRNAIQDMSFTIENDEWVAIIGHNGSGKSTLAKSIDGLLPLEKGTIIVNGIELSEANLWQVRDQIGMVFQNPDNQFVGATVEDDVAFGLENRGVPRAEMVQRVQDALQRVNMTAFATREPAHLSGGQKQRVALAGIIAVRPQILILDEATSMLDPKGRQDVLATIRQLKAETHMTVLSITHDIDEAASADRILVIDDGQLKQQGTPAEIFRYGSRLIKMGLDVPYTAKVAEDLSTAGVALPSQFLDESELAQTLWTLHSQM
ncbi:cobalt transporter ATP-binding subunit [Lactobacillus selangorensis]|uniref:Cobalt transporter ATP-binding subunit n=1 Tax=Lactobacillus selangorensis TaxID=81857 RepID=A0A0R2FKJ8_9LACO|nr:energy-coupling factor ABC transporter ATP-binding protein [Lactobacillus selangorensis]KRN29161.1 cobalt transporter ATP-binding subunit [Lactobacillus selangorensis]KRN31481.1 cobalt transporter ATP-binding subunit [Lactobacillus selangorensis]